MTKAKAATVSAALINAGFTCRAIKISDDDWKIRSSAQDGFVVPVGTVNTFITNQDINGNVAEVEYS